MATAVRESVDLQDWHLKQSWCQVPLSYEMRSCGYTVFVHVLHFSPPPPNLGAGLAAAVAALMAAETER